MNTVAATTTPVSVAARPTSAKKARTATVVRAAKKAPEPEPEAGFWRKVFLPDGKKEVKSDDYQKWQAELQAQKEANKKRAAEKEGGCVIM
jgi:hypothetical protein